MKKPKTLEAATEVITPIGADRLALRVSSARCADASKPLTQSRQPIRFLSSAQGMPAFLRQRELRQQNPRHRHISRTGPDTPPNAIRHRYRRPIIERPEHERPTLMSRRLDQHGQRDRRNAHRMQKDGRVIQIAEHMHPERIHHPMAHQQRDVNANDLPRRRLIRHTQHRRRRAHQPRQSKRNPRRDRDLPQEIEPASHPGRERRHAGGTQRRGPEIRPCGGGACADDLGHAQRDEEREERDDEPADGHDGGAAVGESVGEECGYAGDYADDTEGDAEGLEEVPVAPELLTVAELLEFDFVKVRHGCGAQRDSSQNIAWRGPSTLAQQSKSMGSCQRLALLGCDTRKRPVQARR